MDEMYRYTTSFFFPQELLDAVIDHLKNDKRSLSQCALVSHRWVNRSRRHLFRAITITLHAVEGPDGLTWDNHDMILVLDFLNTSPDIRNYFQDLTIREDPDDDSEQQPRLPITQLFQLRSLLTELKHLLLRNVTIVSRSEDRDEDISSMAICPVSHLRQLSLKTVDFVSKDGDLSCPFVDLIEFLGSIGTLRIEDWICHYVRRDPAGCPRKVPVSSIVIGRRRGDLPFLEPLLKGTIASDEISRVVFTLPDIDSWLSFDAFLEALDARKASEVEVNLDGSFGMLKLSSHYSHYSHSDSVIFRR